MAHLEKKQMEWMFYLVESNLSLVALQAAFLSMKQVVVFLHPLDILVFHQIVTASTL